MGRCEVEGGVVTETKPKKQAIKVPRSTRRGQGRAAEDHAESSLGGITAQEPRAWDTLNLTRGQW